MKTKTPRMPRRAWKPLEIHELREPDVPTHFEVQAYLYAALRELGFNVRAEVTFRCATGARVQFDLAEFVDGLCVGVIEVKPQPVKHKTSEGWAGTRQGERYSSLPVPVRIVYGMAHAEQVVEHARTQGSLWEANG